MKKTRPLCLYEEILLLALHDEKGTVHFGASFVQAAGGAILAELLLDERLGVEGEKRKARIVARNASPTGDPLLDECLQSIADDKKNRTAADWVMRFSGIKRLQHRIAARLVDQGILGQKQDKVLLLFNRTIYPEVDSAPEREIIERIRRAVTGSSSRVDARTVVLIALAKHTGLLRHAMDKNRIKQHKHRIEKIIAGDIISSATREAMQAVEAALMVAVMVPAVVSTSASG